jgi:hypothetical protein
LTATGRGVQFNAIFYPFATVCPRQERRLAMLALALRLISPSLLLPPA